MPYLDIGIRLARQRVVAPEDVPVRIINGKEVVRLGNARVLLVRPVVRGTPSGPVILVNPEVHLQRLARIERTGKSQFHGGDFSCRRHRFVYRIQSAGVVHIDLQKRIRGFRGIAYRCALRGVLRVVAVLYPRIFRKIADFGVLYRSRSGVGDRDSVFNPVPFRSVAFAKKADRRFRPGDICHQDQRNDCCYKIFHTKHSV